MSSEEEGGKLDATEGAVHYQGYASGVECYINVDCPFCYYYDVFHTLQHYGHQMNPAMLYNYVSQPSVPRQPMNHTHESLGPPGSQPLHHPQVYHYAQCDIEGLHHPVLPEQAPFKQPTRNNRQRRGRSMIHRRCPTNYQHMASSAPYDECRFSSIETGSQTSSLMLSGDFNEDKDRAVSFVKRIPNATLFAIEGFISEVAAADDWSRLFIQERLKVGSQKEQRLGLAAALSSLSILCYDKRGSGMLQDLFTYGAADTKKELMDALYKEGILHLSMDIHGCRVVQEAIRCIEQDDLSKLIAEFHDHALALIHDSHGNHVIQRCIQAQSFFAKTAESEGDHDGASKLMGRLQFIIDYVITHIESLSLHRFGCRVVQRCLEFGTKKQISSILEAITPFNDIIVGDMYGNYVVQQAIVTGGDAYRNSVIKTLTREDGSLCRLSKQKYASNVVERVLQHGSIKQKEFIVKELLKANGKSGVCSVVGMAQDRFANYVIQKALESAPEGEHKQKLVEELDRHRDELMKSSYAKYIVVKFLSW